MHFALYRIHRESLTLYVQTDVFSIEVYLANQDTLAAIVVECGAKTRVIV